MFGVNATDRVVKSETLALCSHHIKKSVFNRDISAICHLLPCTPFVVILRNDEKTAADYKIQGGSVLHLVLALRGGQARHSLRSLCSTPSL